MPSLDLRFRHHHHFRHAQQGLCMVRILHLPGQNLCFPTHYHPVSGLGLGGWTRWLRPPWRHMDQATAVFKWVHRELTPSLPAERRREKGERKKDVI